MSTKTYDPKQMKITFGGLILGAFADGTFLEVERDEDTFSRKVGASGEACWVRNRNRGGKITFTVMQDSLTNDGLSAFVVVDELTGQGVQSFFAAEANGTTAVHSGECRISKPAKVTRGKEHNSVEWTIDCADIDIFNGGLL